MASAAPGTICKVLAMKLEEGRLGKRMSRDTPNYSRGKIALKIKQSPRDIGILIVIEAPVKDQQLTVICKTLKEYHNNNEKG